MLEKLTLKKTIRMILFLVPLAVLASVSYTLWSSGDANLSALLDISVPWLLAAVFLSLAPWVVAAIRLGLWARFFHLPMSTRDIFEIVLANDVAAAATPTAIGGGYAKLGLLIFHGTKPGLAASLMLIGSLEEYTVFALLVPIVWFFSRLKTSMLRKSFSNSCHSVHCSPWRSRSEFLSHYFYFFATARRQSAGNSA